MNIKIVPVVIGVFLSITLCATILAPVVSDAQNVVGTPTSESNAMIFGDLHYDYGDNMELSMTINSGSVTALTLNGMAIEYSAYAWNPLFVSDVGVCRVWPAVSGNVFMDVAGATSAENQTIIYSNGTWSISAHNKSMVITAPDSTTTTLVYSWIMYIQPNGKYVQVESGTDAISGKNWEQDVVLFGDSSTTGFSCRWTYGQGTLKTQDGLTGEITSNQTKVDGTTDIYTNGFVLNLDNGSDTLSIPATSMLIIETVDGHKDSGGAYSLVGVLPVMVLIATLVSITAVLIFRRD